MTGRSEPPVHTQKPFPPWAMRTEGCPLALRVSCDASYILGESLHSFLMHFVTGKWMGRAVKLLAPWAYSLQ